MIKKTLKRLLCTALTVSLIIPAFSAATVSGVTIGPRFGKAVHVGVQCEYVAEQLNLNATQEAAMEKATLAADSFYGETKGFHARKGTNYLACLKALELYGVRIEKVDDIEGYILGRMPDISKEDETYINQMMAAIKDHFNRNKHYTREQKRYAIAGFGIHLIGDMFAHRTMLKKSSVENWGLPNTPTKEYFQTKDFKEDRVEEFKSLILQGKLCTVDMRPYMKDRPVGEKKGSVYIDNPLFMPRRVAAAKRTALSFVETVFMAGIAFPDINYYLEEYNLQLENFAQYKAAL